MTEHTPTTPSGGIFKSSHLSSQKQRDETLATPATPHSARMDQALRLREALHGGVASSLTRKQLISELRTPRQESPSQYEDTEDSVLEEEFAVASIPGQREGGAGENEEPNVCSNFARSALIAKLDVKSPCTPPGDRQGGSVSSKVFQDQLSARFRSRSQTQTLAKVTSMDSSDETYGS